MATYFMFGRYSNRAVGNISAERTDEATRLIEANGGTLQAGYALLGAYDLVIIAEFPGTEAALKASVELSRMTAIGFTTAPAITIEQFDELVGA